MDNSSHDSILTLKFQQYEYQHIVLVELYLMIQFVEIRHCGVRAYIHVALTCFPRVVFHSIKQ